MIEVSRTSVERTDRSFERLNDLAVGSGAEAPHLVPVEEIDAAFLARADQEAPVHAAARVVRKQHNPARSKVHVRSIEVQLVERREIVGNCEPSCRRELEETVAVSGAVLIGIE